CATRAPRLCAEKSARATRAIATSPARSPRARSSVPSNRRRAERLHRREVMRDAFHRFAVWTSKVLGAPWSFFLACAVVAAWLLSGPIFGFSDTWQLVINTATTIVTFLMVFLIQNTQNRDAQALHLKLDELIRANRRARNELIDLESLSDRELADL